MLASVPCCWSGPDCAQQEKDLRFSKKTSYQQDLAYSYKGIPKKSVILPVGAKPCF